MGSATTAEAASRPERMKENENFMILDRPLERQRTTDNYRCQNRAKATKTRPGKGTGPMQLHIHLELEHHDTDRTMEIAKKT